MALGLSLLAEREPRRALSIAAHLVLRSGQVIDTTLVDLSSRGCKAKIAGHLFPGDAVSLSIPGRGALGCSVRWCKAHFVGLEFDPEDSSPRAEIPRINARVPIQAEITLRRIGRPNFRVTLQNVSLEGCRVEVIERPAIGEAMQIMFPGLATVNGNVRWVDGFVAGLTFTQPFHRAVFDLLVERLR